LKAARARPNEGSDSSSFDAPTPAANAASPENFSQLERAASLLLVHFGSESPTGARVIELIGADRSAWFKEKSEADAERLRFEFESLGEDEEAVTAALMQSIERGVLDEEIATVRDALRTAEQDRKIDDALELSNKLTALARRRQTFRA